MNHKSPPPKIWRLLSYCILMDISLAAISVDHVDVGFSAANMDYVDNDGVFLRSVSNSFVLAFLNPGRDTNYFLCVRHVDSQTVVWAANRDVPVAQTDSLVFSRDGNAAVILGADGRIAWSANTSGWGVQRMQLRDSGNLVLLNSANDTVWQSFDHPTDTLLSGQILTPGMQLVSSSSTTNFSSGPYLLSMQSEDLLLSVNYNPPQIYWSMTQDRRTVRLSSSGTLTHALLDGSGLSLVENNSAPVLQISFPGGGPSTSIRRAWLDPNGNLQLHTYVSGIWSPYFEAVKSDCSFPLSCGPYGICSGSGQCNCPELIAPLNSSDGSQGCQSHLRSSCSNSSTIYFYAVGSGLDYFANQFSIPIKTSGVEACQQLCMHNCSCLSVFFYHESNSCFLLRHLGTIQSVGNQNHSAYLKVDSLPQAKAKAEGTLQVNEGPSRFVVPAIIGGTAFMILFMICCFAWWFLYFRQRSTSSEETLDDETFLDTIPGLPARYSYRQLQIATNYFIKKLGSGGFGSVYEGVLPDKSRVAVKQLESVGQGKKEFRAEVAIIGNIHHVHLVRLRGFCAEGMHRLLVYEYMANGSLDNCLVNGSDQKRGKLLDWNTRYNIALGTARGLAYLHDDCREKIIHCDIKPENILLDDDYVAKVSDFGLAKLINKEQSQVFTTLRGTRGYLAPEWLMNLRLSDKSDVYSFGMVLLEIISGRKNFDPAETSEKWYFPAYAFYLAENGKLEELVDAKLRGTTDFEQVIRAVRIALWCIQEEAHVRPSMGRVVQMLEGNILVPEAPLSSQFAVMLHSRMVEAMNNDEQTSAPSPYNSHDSISATCLSEPR